MVFIYRLIIILIVTSLSAISNADVYMWKDKDGKAHFSDRKEKKSDAKEIMVKPVNTSNSVEIKEKHRPIKKILSAAEKKASLEKIAKKWQAKNCKDDVVADFGYNSYQGRCVRYSLIPIVSCRKKVPRKYRKYIVNPEPLFIGGSSKCPIKFPDVPDFWRKGNTANWTPKK